MMELRVAHDGYSFGHDWYAVQENVGGELGWVNRVGNIIGEEKAHEIMHQLETAEGGLKLIAGIFSQPIEPTVQAVREHFQNSTGLTLYGFTSKDEAEAVAAKFPKYAKVKAHACSGNGDFLHYGIACERVGVNKYGIEFKTYGVSLSVSSITQVTGSENETGNKRVEAFVKGLQAQGFIS